MLFRTHIVFGLFLLLLFFGFVDNKYLFFIFGFIGIIVPDLDSKYSKFGRRIVFRPIQFFLSHRGIIHSLIFGIVVGLVIGIFSPAASPGFFIGFASHILIDSFTKEGVAAFYPIKKRSHGLIETGSFTESFIFYGFLLVDSIMILLMVFRFFN